MIKNKEVPNIDEEWRLEKVSEKQIDKILDNCMKKVMESCNCICGFIPDKSINNN
jgi:hypothetical protein